MQVEVKKAQPKDAVMSASTAALLGKRLVVLLIWLLAMGRGILIGGFQWEVLRPFAMKLQMPFDSITIDLDKNDQLRLKDLIEL